MLNKYISAMQKMKKNGILVSTNIYTMSLPTFITEDVFVQSRLMHLPQEQKETLLEQMNDLIMKRVMISIIQYIPEKEKDSLKAENTDSMQDIVMLMKQYVPNFSELLAEEIESVKELIVTSAETVQE